MTLYGGNVTETTPTIANTTSTTILAANTQRRYLRIENRSAANIMVSLSGNTLTGIAPTATNKGIVLVANDKYESDPLFVPIGAITCYQSSGGSINTVVVVEG